MEYINLTIAQYSRIYGPKKTKIYALIRAGRLQKVRIDGRTYVTVESANALNEQSLVKKGEA